MTQLLNTYGNYNVKLVDENISNLAKGGINHLNSNIGK